MAGHGPPPKPRDQRARGKRSEQAIPLRVVYAEPVEQPELPEFDVQITQDGKLITQRFAWPDRTREWWSMWGESPLSADFTETDWSELLDTAYIHAQFWRGDLKLAGELRLRAAKFGATPEDRARLRIQFATAEEAEAKSGARASNPQASRKRYKAPDADTG